MRGIRKRAVSRDQSNFFRNLLLIALGALLLRVAVSWELGTVNGGHNSVFAPSTLSDLATYMKLAREVAAFNYSGVFYYQPFYYAVFLPVLYWLFANSIWAVILVQSLLGAATSLLAGLSAGRLFGRIGGYTAAVLVAISTPLLLYTPYHQNETLQSFNLILLFYLSLRVSKHPTWMRLLSLGLMAGIAILTRGNIWLLLPGVIAAIMLSGVRNHRSILWQIGALALFCLPLLAVQLPFAIHNTIVTGKLTGPSTAADAVLALGNSVEAPPGGRNPGLPAGPMEYPEAYQRMMKRSAQGESVPLQMLEMLSTQPGAFLELQFRKLLLFWDCREIPNNVSLYGEGQSSLILRNLLPGRSLVLISLVIAGLLVWAGKLCRKRQTEMLLLYWFIGAYWAAISIFYILSRFRAPVLPLLAVAAGGYLAWARCCWQRNSPRRRQRLLCGGAALLFGFWLTTFSYDFYRDNLESGIMRLVRPDGTVVTGGGKPEERFDYGPFTFGGWSEIALEQGGSLTKRFIAPVSAGELEWSILTMVPGRITFRVNGGAALTLDAPNRGINQLKFPVSLQAGVVQLEIVGIEGEHHLLFDRQRNYQRSTLGDSLLPGEWIMRFLSNSAQH